MPAASSAAAARLRTVPPIPTSRAAARLGSQSALRELLRQCARSALSCLPLVLSPGRKRSVMRTAPSGHERVSSASRPRPG